MALSDVHIVVNKHTPYVVQAFERIGKVTALDTHEITPETVKDADILIVRSETKVDQKLLEGSRIKFVGTVTIGTDHIDENYLARSGITFTSAPGSNSNSVAEYITAALLELSVNKKYFLSDKTIGVVGVGNVGSKVWRKAEALGMKVILNDPPLQRQGSDYPSQSLDELMSADIITVHVPLTRDGADPTYHLFDEQRLRKMKQGSIFINTSRGGVMETKGLYNVLDSGHLSTSILDVWEAEPTIDVSLLEKVFIGTPHIAGYSLDGKVNALRMNYSAVCRFLGLSEGQEIETLIPKPAIPTITIEKRSSIEKVVRDAVQNCYNIVHDDQLLRKINAIPLNDRGKYFSRLRAEYRIRREFRHTRLKIVDENPAITNTLISLGFSIA